MRYFCIVIPRVNILLISEALVLKIIFEPNFSSHRRVGLKNSCFLELAEAYLSSIDYTLDAFTNISYERSFLNRR